MENPDNRVEYDIWYTSTDDWALDFIENFLAYDNLFGDKALMTPHFVTFDCQDCDAEFKKKECFDDGRFCALNHKNIKMQGTEIILEDVRQSCIYNQSMTEKGSPKLYWSYMQRVHSVCTEYINEDCSKTAHKDIGLDFKTTQNCVFKTFGVDKKKSITYKSVNTFLESEWTYWNNYGANFYPSIVINNWTYRGVFEP